jgi:hypothetical protein
MISILLENIRQSLLVILIILGDFHGCIIKILLEQQIKLALEILFV